MHLTAHPQLKLQDTSTVPYLPPHLCSFNHPEHWQSLGGVLGLKFQVKALSSLSQLPPFHFLDCYFSPDATATEKCLLKPHTVASHHIASSCCPHPALHRTCLAHLLPAADLTLCMGSYWGFQRQLWRLVAPELWCTKKPLSHSLFLHSGHTKATPNTCAACAGPPRDSATPLWQSCTSYLWLPPLPA